MVTRALLDKWTRVMYFDDTFGSLQIWTYLNAHYEKSSPKFIFLLTTKNATNNISISIHNINLAAAAAKSLQSCPTLCDPIDGSPPDSPIPGILQARTLEWVAISFSNA